LACHQHPEWLLTGAGGQFGQALLTSKSVGIELIATSRSGGGEDGASLDAAAGSQPVDAVIFAIGGIVIWGNRQQAQDVTIAMGRSAA